MRRLESLSVEECLALLQKGYMGRLAFVREGVPEIRPLNYRYHEGSVVFRMTYGDTLDLLADNAPVVFEIDDADPTYHTGWSVLVHGRAEEVSDPAEIDRLREAVQLQPWAPGERSHYVRILPSAISGRRIP